MSETLKLDGRYRIADIPFAKELEAIGVKKYLPEKFRHLYVIRNYVYAVPTGVKRPPRKGEWYLSGTQIEAYKAPNDLTTDYYLARLVNAVTAVYGGTH